MFNSGIFPRYLLFQHPVSPYSLSVSLVGAGAIKIISHGPCLQGMFSPYWDTTDKGF